MEPTAEAPSAEPQEQEQEQLALPEAVDVVIVLPNKKTVVLRSVSIGETLNAVRFGLAEFQETAFTTCFTWKFVSAQDASGAPLEVESTECHEYSALSSFVGLTTKSCTFAIVEDSYDVNKARAHLKRFHEVIGKPFLPTAEMRLSVEDKDEQPAASNFSKESLPNIVTLLQSPDLSKYYSVALAGSLERMAGRPLANHVAPLSEAIKNVSISGWNPVPVSRKLQGDLFYLEVVLANEGTVYVTSSTNGFFVNNCSRHYFDPSPAANAHYSHDLFATLYSFSSGVKSAWVAFHEGAEAAVALSSSQEPLDAVAEMVLTGTDLKLTKETSAWMQPSASCGTAEDTYTTKKHTYDSARAQEDLLNLCGPEALGAPREWNDEIQSISALKPQDFTEKVMKAKLEHKVISEFTESCKQIVVAITEGRIAPLTVGDPAQSDIFVYNGIFFNRAEDAKDAFKICEGEDACRKITARDFNNQKLIRAMGVDNLTTVLCAIVDYKGVRYVGQSIIPGILTQGENSAQLLYGILEKNKPLTVKNGSLKIMRELAGHLSIPERAVSRFPFGEEIAPVVAEGKDSDDPLTKLLASADNGQNTTIRVDTADDVEVVDGSVAHVGPIEAKIIRGADGRNYIMEVMRLTPRDANFVKEGGTGLISAEMLDPLDDHLLNSFVLRQELVSIYMHRKVNLARQALLLEATQKEEEAKKAAEAAAPNGAVAAATPAAPAAESTETPKVKDSVEVEDVENDGDNVQIVKDTATDEVDDAVLNTLATEYIEKFRAISPQSLGIEINPNVFLNFSSSTSPELRAKDEETARDLATFLMSYVLPVVTRQVRECEFYPKDLDSMVSILHRMGINMRYLGTLAGLAAQQENEDAELLKQGRQRVHSMPFYWQEFLIVEMLARSCKHLLNNTLRADKSVSNSPAESIASILNHLLSLFTTPQSKPETETVEKTKKASGKASQGSHPGKKKSAAPLTGSASHPASASTETGDKKKKSGKKGKHHGTLPVEIPPTREALVPAPNAFADRAAFLQALAADLQSSFLYKFALLTKALQPDAQESEEEQLANTLLRTRFSPAMLLRRVAQQCGIVIAGRKYDFQSEVVFRGEDIVDLVPRTKSFEPDSYLPEFSDFLNSAAQHMQQGNAFAAYEMAQQASNIINQITGPNHPHAFQAADQLTAVLVSSSDSKSGLQTSQRCLSLSAQVQGLDCQDTLQHHLQLSYLYMDMNDNGRALQHLLTARYLLQLIAGDRHPEMATILVRLSVLYERAGDFEGACQALLQARFFANDLMKNCMILLSLASLCSRNGRVHEALEFQKNGYKTLKELVNTDDERLVDAKKNLETYIRAASAAPRVLSAVGNALSSEDRDEDDDEGAEGGAQQDKAPGSKKKRNNKKSKGKK